MMDASDADPDLSPSLQRLEAEIRPLFRPPGCDSALPQIPGYTLVEELGSGGMGIVYKAKKENLDRFVALKVIREGLWAGEDSLARFRAEANSVAQLKHPHVVTLHDYGEFEGRPYL